MSSLKRIPCADASLSRVQNLQKPWAPSNSRYLLTGATEFVVSVLTVFLVLLCIGVPLAASAYAVQKAEVNFSSIPHVRNQDVPSTKMEVN